MNEAVFTALYHGIHEASVILPKCRSRQEKRLLLAFITQASVHMAKLKPKEPSGVEVDDIDLRTLIDSEQVVRDLKERFNVSTITDLISLKNIHTVQSALDGEQMESSDDTYSEEGYDETRLLRKVVFAMCPKVIGKNAP